MRLLAASPGSLPLPAAPENALQHVLQQQERCGLDVLSDGQLSWADPVSHLAGQLTGVELIGESRYLDTPLTIRQPGIRGPFAWAVPIVRPEYARSAALTAKPVKPVLTGALTLARHMRVMDPYYQRDFARLVMDLNEALVCEVRQLAAAGARLIQIDEPAILQDPQPGFWRLLNSCVRRLNTAKAGAQLIVNIGWGDPAPVMEQMFAVPADIIGLDLTRNPRLATFLAHAELRAPLQLGIVDGSSKAPEDAGQVASVLEEFVATSSAPECYLSAATGLRMLTGQAAGAKLQVLSQVRDNLTGKQGR